MAHLHYVSITRCQQGRLAHDHSALCTSAPLQGGANQAGPIEINLVRKPGVVLLSAKELAGISLWLP